MSAACLRLARAAGMGGGTQAGIGLRRMSRDMRRGASPGGRSGPWFGIGRACGPHRVLHARVSEKPNGVHQIFSESPKDEGR